MYRGPVGTRTLYLEISFTKSSEDSRLNILDYLQLYERIRRENGSMTIDYIFLILLSLSVQ